MSGGVNILLTMGRDYVSDQCWLRQYDLKNNGMPMANRYIAVNLQW